MTSTFSLKTPTRIKETVPTSSNLVMVDIDFTIKSAIHAEWKTLKQLFQEYYLTCL